ncbi:hypothetical protein E8E13_008260 [Curvularia kusanoi]|uniref:MYND-type domain-containing protein n=1 Tax=Curvularia kusanoi TaxID=90978 RepID=A0A9P4TFL3_CURKU|nr:hypothetical protein E8E13_008260 [Curvularia kusanoi]
MVSTGIQDFGTPLLLEEHTSVTPPLTATSPPLCAACHSPNSPQRCSTCKSIHYCSAACQKADWALHRLLCKQHTKSSQPDSTYRRALYLQGEKGKPHFVWLKYGNDGLPLDKAKCFPSTPASEVKTIAFHNRYRPYWIQISYDSNQTRRELKGNGTVRQLLGTTTAEVELAWRGPLLVLAYSAEDGLSKPALDIDVDALGPLAEYLRLRAEYRGPVFVEQPQKRYTEEEWKEIISRAPKVTLMGVPR